MQSAVYRSDTVHRSWPTSNNDQECSHAHFGGRAGGRAAAANSVPPADAATAAEAVAQAEAKATKATLGVRARVRIRGPYGRACGSVFVYY